MSIPFSGGDPMASDGARPVPADSRFVQANERTLLAWIRTGLALVTFGLVIARLGSWVRALTDRAPASDSDGYARLLGGAFVTLGAVANVLALVRYLQVRRALVRGTPIASDFIPTAFGFLVALFGVLVLFAI